MGRSRTLGGIPPVLFGGGDGWIYSFDPTGDGKGHSKLLWKFDCNPKASKYSVSGKSERNHLIGTPVIYDNKVYIGNEVGAILCFEHSQEYKEPVENDMGNSVFSTPISANNVLYVTNKNELFAIGTM